MTKDLTPSGRAFLNETREAASKLIITSTNLLEISKKETIQVTQAKKIEEIVETGKSVEIITKQIRETLSIENVTPVTTRYHDEEEASKTQIVREENCCRQTPSSVEINIVKVLKTPPKAIFVTERTTTPVSVINKEVIISPIPTPLESKISQDPNRNTHETIAYYRSLVTDKTMRLDDLIETWDAICNENTEQPISEDNQGNFINF